MLRRWNEARPWWAIAAGAVGLVGSAPSGVITIVGATSSGLRGLSGTASPIGSARVGVAPPGDRDALRPGRTEPSARSRRQTSMSLAVCFRRLASTSGVTALAACSAGAGTSPATLTTPATVSTPATGAADATPSTGSAARTDGTAPAETVTSASAVGGASSSSARLIAYDFEGGLDALTSGAFTVRDGCVGIAGPRGGWQMAVFPSSVHLDGDVLRFGDGDRSATLGDVVDIGGGGFDPDDADRFHAGLAAELATCPSSETVWLVNSRLP